MHYDLGADSQKLTLSLAGIIVVSIFISLDLLGLLATAIYASWFPRWTIAGCIQYAEAGEFSQCIRSS